jgi:hypothetical protein
MNPTITNVVEAFNAVPVNGASIAIDRTGVVLPSGGHISRYSTPAR